MCYRASFFEKVSIYVVYFTKNKWDVYNNLLFKSVKTFFRFSCNFFSLEIWLLIKDSFRFVFVDFHSISNLCTICNLYDSDNLSNIEKC